MKITGGIYKGRKIYCPKGQETRPATSSRREDIFNILFRSMNHEIHQVVDFFAGSASLGIESLSRGADYVLYFDSSKEAQKVIVKNHELLEISPSAFDLIGDERIFAWNKILRKKFLNTKIDTIFCDPPYGQSLLPKSLIQITKSSDLIADNAVLSIEKSVKDKMQVPENWILERERRYGMTEILFFRFKRS